MRKSGLVSFSLTGSGSSGDRNFLEVSHTVRRPRLLGVVDSGVLVQVPRVRLSPLFYQPLAQIDVTGASSVVQRCAPCGRGLTLVKRVGTKQERWAGKRGAKWWWSVHQERWRGAHWSLRDTAIHRMVASALISTLSLRLRPIFPRICGGSTKQVDLCMLWKNQHISSVTLLCCLCFLDPGVGLRFASGCADGGYVTRSRSCQDAEGNGYNHHYHDDDNNDDSRNYP